MRVLLDHSTQEVGVGEWESGGWESMEKEREKRKMESLSGGVRVERERVEKKRYDVRTVVAVGVDGAKRVLHPRSQVHLPRFDPRSIV